VGTRNYFEEIKRAKSGNEESMLYLIECFDRLLKPYAYRLSYGFDDSYADLRCEFIALIMRFNTENHFVNNGAVIRYIQKSVRNSYIRLSKKRTIDKKVVAHNELSDKQVVAIENESGVTDDYPGVYFDILKKLLTTKEFKVLYRHYILDFTIEEIAEQDGISRKNTYKRKAKAIEKLKKFYDMLE